MTQIQLRIYRDPGQAELFLNVKRQDGDYDKWVALVDTGAQMSLLPNFLMDNLDWQPTGQETITIEQAGIANQTFQAVEAFITVFLEDTQGHQTGDFSIRVWFAETNIALIGFADLLDQAVLHVDMLNMTGYLTIEQ